MNTARQQKNNTTTVNADPLQKLFAFVNRRISHGQNVYLQNNDGDVYVIYPKNVLYVRKGKKYNGAGKYTNAIFIYYINKLVVVWFENNQLHVYDEGDGQ